MKILLLHSKIFTYTFIIANLLFANVLFGQTVGDYRSVATGNWTDSGSWQYYNGSTWVSATNYPGQGTTGAVLIQAGDVINIGTPGISTATMGTLTINGQLVLTGINTGGVGTDFFFNTQTIIVTPLLGTIKFVDKVNLKLPTNATLQVKFDLTLNPDYYGLIGDCNHNQDIVIGSSTYAYCNGGGSTGLTFYEVMSGGGTLNSAPSSDSPICYGDTIMLYGDYIGPIGTGITYNWTITDPNGTSTAVTAKNTSVINAISGNYVIKLTCSTVYGSVAYSNSETILVTVNPLLSPPTVGTIIQPTCASASGSVVLSDLPASGTLNQTKGTVVTSSPITGTTMTITDLDSGTYTYSVSNGSCTSASSSSVTIISPDKTWNGLISENWDEPNNWTPTGVPTSSNCVIIPSATISPTISGTNVVAYANNLTILTSGALTVESSNTLTVTDFVDVELGFLNFENTASLVQINNVTTKANSGFIDYQRITAARKTDYTYWSSPVTPMTFEELYPMGGTFYSYEATSAGEDWSPFDAGTEMVAGRGYIANQGAEIPSVAPPSDELDVTFTGVPNNGNITIPVLYTGIDSLGTSNLIGNPYPSALDADKFLTDNAGVLDGTLYFWTHNTAFDLAGNITNAGTGTYAYSGDDYASYNLTGGVGIENAKGGVSAPSDPGYPVLPSVVDTGKKPTGKIASGQGFFATGIAAGSITFNNDMRVGVIDITKEDNSQFFKTKNPKKSSKTIEKNRLWLNLTNTQGAFKQTLVGYVTDATNNYDNRFDGESYDGHEFVDFYSVNQDKNLVIQGRALPFDENDEVPLGFRTTINGAFTINIDQVDGLLANQAVFLEDKLTNTVFDLKSGNYTFNTVAGTFNDRFVLRYSNISNSKTLGTASLDALKKTVLVSNKNKQIKIDSAVEMIDKVTVFDILGRQIYQKANVNSNELSISNLVSNRQVVIVKTLLQNGQEVSSKIVY